MQKKKKKRKENKKKKWDYNDDNDASIKFIYCMMTLLRVRNYKRITNNKIFDNGIKSGAPSIYEYSILVLTV